LEQEAGLTNPHRELIYSVHTKYIKGKEEIIIRRNYSFKRLFSMTFPFTPRFPECSFPGVVSGLKYDYVYKEEIVNPWILLRLWSSGL
jgi:hypothetical protein